MRTRQLLLLVEDDPVISLLLEDAMTQAGYEVVISTDGKGALR